jgi:hypothetical protein
MIDCGADDYSPNGNRRLELKKSILFGLYFDHRKPGMFQQQSASADQREVIPNQQNPRRLLEH